MKTKCPSCGFEGNIKDELIGDGGRNISCPRCKTTFFFKKEARSGATTPAPTTGGDMDISTGEFTLPNRRAPRGRQPEAHRTGVGLTPLFALLILAVIIGIAIGRYTHDYTFNSPFKKVIAPSLTPTTELLEFPDWKTSTPVSDASGGIATANVVPETPTEPSIPEENFTSDVYLDIAEIDGKVNEVSSSTGVKREMELKEYGQGLVGKNLAGYFVVMDVGNTNASFKGILPLGLYHYYVQAESQSESSIKNVVYLGLKEIDDLTISLEKGAKVYIQGYIYGCVFKNDHFEMGLANGHIETR